MAPGGDRLAYLAGWDARKVQKRGFPRQAPSLSTAAILRTHQQSQRMASFQAQPLDFATIKLFLKHITNLLKRLTRDRLVET